MPAYSSKGAIVALEPKAEPMEKIVPLVGPSVRGPLGVAHLPRLWLKAVLAAANVLPEDYSTNYGGTNKILLDGIGLDPEAASAYLATRPNYMAFETWVREHAKHLDVAAVTATNAALGTKRKPPERAADMRAIIGLTDSQEDSAPLLDSLDDWSTIHAVLVARRGKKMEPVVPAVSSQSVGLLGLMHLPRFWMKASLNGAGALYDTWRSGPNSPFDVWFCGIIGLDLDTAIAHIHGELPAYLAFESWTVARAQHISPAEIAAHNAAMRVREKPEEVAVRERAFLGMDAPDYKPSIELNDLVDWHTIHAGL
jgi:hypothetical protein